MTATTPRPWPVGMLALGLLGLLGARADGQAEIRDPTRPILVLDTGGHSAPVMGLAFTADGTRLVSAGEDKVVRIWGLDATADDPPAVIRPPIWRGLRGNIFALALSRPDAQGRQLVAVAGYGMQSSNGGITLYRIPGADPSAAAELVGFLSADVRNADEPAGHWDSVRALTFSPDGRWLASAGFDATVRIWDVEAKRTVAVLGGHGTSPVMAVAYNADGRRLTTAGGDGEVVVWDVNPDALRDLDRRRAAEPAVAGRKAMVEAFSRAAERARARPRPDDARDAVGRSINALALSPDGRYVVIGRESGRLTRYDAADLGNRLDLPTGARQAAVEAIAFHPDSARLATSILSRRIDRPADRPWAGCDIEVRRIADGRVIGPPLPPTDNLVYALAFSPDGRRLAYAGGDDQAVRVADLGVRPPAVVRHAGRGRSVWDVGFTADGRSVGFDWTRRDDGAAPATFWGFDLAGRRVVGIAGADLRRALTTLGGATIRPLDMRRLQVEDGRGGAEVLALDPAEHRRWWSYTFIPPTAEHPRPAVAVGSVAGVVLFARGADGGPYRPVRSLSGHSGAVFALAPSPDGKWLATGSADQTVRLWPLAGRDEPPKLGATFAPGDGGRTAVAAIEPGSPAEASGLKVGDVLEQIYISGKEADAAALAGVDALPPGLKNRVEFRVRRGEAPVNVGTTRQDGPALSYFPAEDREWVLWTPDGFYDTSIVGDRRFLGWHRNAPKAGGGPPDVDLGAPTDYFTIDRFERELRRPDVLDRLIATADPAQARAPVPAAAADPVEVVRRDSPPRVELTGPARPADGRLVVRAPDLQLVARALTEDLGVARRSIASIRFLVDGRVQQEVRPGQAEVNANARLTLPPGDHRVTVVVTNDRGRERTNGFDARYEPPADAPPPARQARLAVLAVGTDRFRGAAIPAIPFARKEVRELAGFFADSAHHRFQPSDEPTVLDGDAAAAADIESALDTLDAARSAGRFGPGDTVVVVIESHVLTADGASRVLGADAAGVPPGPAVPDAAFAACLGELATYGCRVLVLIDGVHPAGKAPAGWSSRVDGLARDLTGRGVITFVASIQGPGERLVSEAHGAFALAVLRSRDAASQSRLPARTDGPPTLAEFRDVVEDQVLRLTGRRQIARCYIPGTILARTPIFEPGAPLAPVAEAGGSE